MAGGVDAAPEPRPAAFVALAEGRATDGTLGGSADEDSAGEEAGGEEAGGNDSGDEGLAAAEAPRAVGVVTADDLAEVRTLGVFSRGEQLRAEAAEEAEAAELARQVEEERLRLREEREAALEAARREEQERLARQREMEEAAAAEAAQTTSAPAESSGGPTAAQWDALRRCESGGNYQITSPNGLYHGAYQFYQGTWDNIARAVGRTDLVGMKPSDAAPADQDAMAQALYSSRGHRPWPHCGAHLR